MRKKIFTDTNILLDSIIMVLFFMMGFSVNTFGQSGDLLQFDLYAAIEKGKNDRPILGLQLQPRQGFASRFSLYAGLKGGGRDFISGDFTVQQKDWGAMGELRIHPFGAQEISFQKLPSWRKRQRQHGCAAFDLKRSPALFQYLRGTYLAFGYRHEVNDFTYLPLPELETLIESFPYSIVLSGPTLRIGYQIRLSWLSAGISYGGHLSQPKWEGPVDIFGDDLYTSTFPLKYRIDRTLRLELGVNF